MKAELIQKSVREGREVVEYQLQTGELMDGVVLKKCKENMISSVLPTGALFEGGRNYVFSYTDQKDTLRKIFSNGVSAAIALKTFENILKTIQYYQQESIQLAYFIYDPDYIYWNSRTNSAEFTCFPIKNTAFDMQDIANGLRKLLAYAVYGENENGDYVAKLLSAINRGADLETILGTVEVLMHAYGIETEKKPVAEPEAVPQAVEQPVVEPQAAPQPEVAPEAVEQPKVVPEIVPQAVEQPVVEPQAAAQPEVTPQPQAVPQPDAVPHPYLIRTKTGEKIMLTDGDFVIGKSANNTNYVVTDNTAVSRVHCTIYKKKGAFFVRDERSTNSTFVNGEQVLPGMDHVLINNCKLVLGDEEFTYHLW